MMDSVTFNQFQNLTKEKQLVTYENLSDHDKFLARINDNIDFNTIGFSEVSKEEQINAKKKLLGILTDARQITPKQAQQILEEISILEKDIKD